MKGAGQLGESSTGGPERQGGRFEGTEVNIWLSYSQESTVIVGLHGGCRAKP